MTGISSKKFKNVNKIFNEDTRRIELERNSMMSKSDKKDPDSHETR